MDKRKNLAVPSSGHDKTSSAEPIPADPVSESTIVFCGDPAQVSAGLAVALRLMGIDQPAPDVSEHEPPDKGNSA